MGEASESVALRVIQAVRAVVPRGARVSRGGRARVPLVEVKVNSHPLRAYWLGTGTPGAVRDALRLLGTRRADVFVARDMTPGGRDAAEKAGVGWIEESGAAEIALEWLVISRSGRPRAAGDRKPVGWTPSVAVVAEALLTGVTPTVQATTEATGLSEGLCTRALSFFTRRELLSADAARGPRSARQLINPDRLLDEYAVAVTHLPPRFDLTVGALWRDPVSSLAEFGRRWDAAGIRWAATGAAASAVLAPFLTDFGTAEVLIVGKSSADLSLAVGAIDATPMEGGRLTVKLFPSEASYRLSQRADGLRVAPWPRVYADLRTVGVRGEDASEHLREVMRAR